MLQSAVQWAAALFWNSEQHSYLSWFQVLSDGCGGRLTWLHNYQI